jgi:hypothetical protein
MALVLIGRIEYQESHEMPDLPGRFRSCCKEDYTILQRMTAQGALELSARSCCLWFQECG